MIELLCLSYSLVIATGNYETSWKLESQDCYLAKQVCELEGGDWHLSTNPYLNDYLAAKWRMTTGRGNIEIRDTKCSSTIPVLAQN